MSVNISNPKFNFSIFDSLKKRSAKHIKFVNTFLRFYTLVGFIYPIWIRSIIFCCFNFLWNYRREIMKFFSYDNKIKTSWDYVLLPIISSLKNLHRKRKEGHIETLVFQGSLGYWKKLNQLLLHNQTNHRGWIKSCSAKIGCVGAWFA